MKFVYIVTYFDYLDNESTLAIGNVYTDIGDALAEAAEMNGFVVPREVIERNDIND